MERHKNLHTARSTTSSCFLRLLLCAAKNSIAKSDALAVALNFLPVPFFDGHKGMKELAKFLFELGQTVVIHANVDPRSYLP